MEKTAKNIGMIFIFSAGILAVAPLGALFGALSGIITGWFFGDTITQTLTNFGIAPIAMWKLGATLGFMAQFLRTRTTVKMEKD